MSPRRIAVTPRLTALLRGGLVCAGMLPHSAIAQPRLPDHTAELGIIESTELDEDPLGLDRNTGTGLDEAAANLPKPAPAPPPSPVHGEVLSALHQVRETRHLVSVRLEQGLAFVHTRMEFSSGANHPAELAYRLALPEEAVVVKVALCPGPRGCLDAQPGSVTRSADYRAWLVAPPGAAGSGVWAEPIVDGRGTALSLRAAPLAPQGELALEVQYVCPAPVRGGQVRLSLPARGRDAGLAFTTVELAAPGLQLATPDRFEWPPESPLSLQAALPAGARLRTPPVRVPCGASRCSRAFEARAAEAPEERPTWLWIDASPSMEGPPRGRVDAVLGALLSRLPPQTPLRAHAFAARVQELGRYRADLAPLAALSQATLLELGAATRPSNLVDALEPDIARERPRILMLSDGLLDARADELKALVRARRRGAELWLVLVGDATPTLPGLAPDHVLQVSQLADAALQGMDFEALADALHVALAREPVEGPRAGEQRVVERKPARLGAPPHKAPWLWFWMRRGAEAPAWWLISGDSASAPSGAPIAAIPYEATAPPEPPKATAMPAESVLDMLRSQLVPRARACLRSDRRGRGDYAVALTFQALFYRREVSEARVEGDIQEDLRACLEALLPGLRVPAFSGGVRVRYPIYTQREAPPPVLELTPDAAEQVQRALAAPQR